MEEIRISSRNEAPSAMMSAGGRNRNASEKLLIPDLSEIARNHDGRKQGNILSGIGGNYIADALKTLSPYETVADDFQEMYRTPEVRPGSIYLPAHDREKQKAQQQKGLGWEEGATIPIYK